MEVFLIGYYMVCTICVMVWLCWSGCFLYLYYTPIGGSGLVYWLPYITPTTVLSRVMVSRALL